jgi:hypothetical protein
MCKTVFNVELDACLLVVLRNTKKTGSYTQALMY